MSITPGTIYVGIGYANEDRTYVDYKYQPTSVVNEFSDYSAMVLSGSKYPIFGITNENLLYFFNGNWNSLIELSSTSGVSKNIFRDDTIISSGGKQYNVQQYSGGEEVIKNTNQYSYNFGVECDIQNSFDNSNNRIVFFNDNNDYLNFYFISSDDNNTYVNFYDEMGNSFDLVSATDTKIKIRTVLYPDKIEIRLFDSFDSLIYSGFKNVSQNLNISYIGFYMCGFGNPNNKYITKPKVYSNMSTQDAIYFLTNQSVSNATIINDWS